MSWQRIDEMPCVLTIIRNAEKEIQSATGTEVLLQLVAVQVGVDQIKQMVKDIVTRYFKVTWHEIESTLRKREVINARHTYMYIMNKIYGYSKTEVANDCGGRDHSTAVVAIQKVIGFYRVGDAIVDDIESIKKLLPAKFTK